jgi:hypothetical protein
MGRKVPPALIGKTSQRVQNGIPPIGNTPLLGGIKESKIDPLRSIRVDKYPERPPIYDKKPRGIV